MSLDTPNLESRWISVVFLQGAEADDALALIDRDGPLAAMAHLERWDYGDETTDAALINGYVYDAVPVGTSDRVIMDDESGYTLTYSAVLGHVSLLRRYVTSPEAAESGDLTAVDGRSRDQAGGFDLDRWRRVAPSVLREKYRSFSR